MEFQIQINKDFSYKNIRWYRKDALRNIYLINRFVYILSQIRNDIKTPALPILTTINMPHISEYPTYVTMSFWYHCNNRFICPTDYWPDYLHKRKLSLFYPSRKVINNNNIIIHFHLNHLIGQLQPCNCQFSRSVSHLYGAVFSLIIMFRKNGSQNGSRGGVVLPNLPKKVENSSTFHTLE